MTIPLPATLDVGTTTIGLRRATADAVPVLVAVLTEIPGLSRGGTTRLQL